MLMWHQEDTEVARPLRRLGDSVFLITPGSLEEIAFVIISKEASRISKVRVSSITSLKCTPAVDLDRKLEKFRGLQLEPYQILLGIRIQRNQCVRGQHFAGQFARGSSSDPLVFDRIYRCRHSLGPKELSLWPSCLLIL